MGGGRTTRRVASAAALAVAVAVAGWAVARHDARRADELHRGRAVATTDLRVVTFNVLHGIFCGEGTDFCLAPVRMAMLSALLEDAGCPELVALQEIGPRQKELVPGVVGSACGGRYQPAWQPGPPDLAQVMVLTSLPVVERGHLDLANVPWEAYWVRVRASVGEVDFLAAHFASGFNNPACAEGICPAVCPPGITTNECHAVEVAAFLASRPPSALQVVAGDLNARPGSRTLAVLTDRGLGDAWLLAGHPECGRATRAGCTSGRERPRNDLDGLDVPSGTYGRRIDFVLVRPGGGCRLTVGAETLAATPTEDPVFGLHWPSDHAGVLAGFGCAAEPAAPREPGAAEATSKPAQHPVEPGAHR